MSPSILCANYRILCFPWPVRKQSSTSKHLSWQTQDLPHSLMKCSFTRCALRTRIRAPRQLQSMRGSLLVNARWYLLTHPTTPETNKHSPQSPKPTPTRTKVFGKVHSPAEITATSLTPRAMMITAVLLISIRSTARPAKGSWPVLVELFLATVELRFEFLLHLVQLFYNDVAPSELIAKLRD